MPELFYNGSIRRLLADLAALNPQLGPVELICGWFDDLYFPCQTPPENYSKDSWERGQREWRSCFAEAELSALSRFHERFNVEVDSLPTDWPGWECHPGWLRVSEAAREAMAALAMMPANQSLQSDGAPRRR